MSLRNKFLLILVAMSALNLIIFGLLANQSFIQDKIAYVFDSGLTLSRGLAGHVSADFARIKERHTWRVQRLTAESPRLDDTSSGGCFFALEPSAGTIAPPTSGACTSAPPAVHEMLLAEFQSLTLQAGRQDFAFKIIQLGGKPFMILTATATNPEFPQLRFFTLEPAHALTDLFERQTVFSHYLVTTSGLVEIGPGGLVNSALSKLASTALVGAINAKKLRAGALLTSSPDGASLLASYSFVDGAEAFILSLAPASAVYRAALPLLLKTGSAILALLAVAGAASMILARNLTTSINSLRSAMKKFGEGHVDMQLEPTSNDEIGDLTLYFNAMTRQIKTLLRQSAEKAQIELEMGTAKRVQETLFPPGLARLGPVEFAGFFEPASSCGGDWWYYFAREETLYLLIGDVTGHGVPAALLTSAARSALAMIEAMPEKNGMDLQPALLLELLNKSVYDTTKGQLQMTFCVGALQMKTGRLTIANASHETPLRLPGATAELKRENLELLQSPLCVRLGEYRDAKFEQETHQLQRGDRVLFYSDGLLDLRNAADEVWPEREMHKALAAACSTSQAPEGAIVLLREKMELFRNKRALVDDLSFFLISYEGGGKDGIQG